MDQYILGQMGGLSETQQSGRRFEAEVVTDVEHCRSLCRSRPELLRVPPIRRFMVKAYAIHNAYYMSYYKLYHRFDVGSTSTEKQIRQKVDPISP